MKELTYYNRAIAFGFDILTSFDLTAIKFDYRNGALISVPNLIEFDSRLKIYNVDYDSLVCKHSFKRGYDPIKDNFIKIPDVRKIFKSTKSGHIIIDKSVLGKFLGYITPLEKMGSKKGYTGISYDIFDQDGDFIESLYGEQVYIDYIDIAKQIVEKYNILANKLNLRIEYREYISYFDKIYNKELKANETNLDTIYRMINNLGVDKVTKHFKKKIRSLEDIDDNLNDLIYWISVLFHDSSCFRTRSKTDFKNEKELGLKYAPKIIKAFNKRDNKDFVRNYLFLYEDVCKLSNRKWKLKAYEECLKIAIDYVNN